MIAHTQAFKTLKDEAQRVFDFAIVVSFAVPALKRTLSKMNAGEPLPFKPDYFDGARIPVQKVSFHAKEYKALLSRFIFLSSFSFFEAYFQDVIREIVAFHGGDALLDRASLAANQLIVDPESKLSKRKLQQPKTASNRDTFLSHGRKLANKGFRFPSTLLGQFGLRRILQLAKDENVKAVEIPRLAEEILQLSFDAAERQTFNGFRTIRNKIAHGRANAAALHLKKAVEANNFLRNLALKIDNHVVSHYLLVEAI